ncbi:MAG: cell wall anchor protein [Firmicutes bacterium]|nr:cell wall anchor protein [Bacillota bacterium]
MRNLTRICCLVIAITAAVSSFIASVYAEPNVDTQKSSTSEFAKEIFNSFSKPSMENRPQLRWWLAEGSHTKQTLLDSMNEIHAAGYGGVEILTLTEATVDKNKYGWGTEEWNNDIRTILKEANKLGMGVSFTSGPNWQPAIPGITPDSDAASKEIVYGYVEVAGDGTYNGAIPKDTMSVKNYGYNQELVGVVGARLTGGATISDAKIMLDPATLIDLNNQEHISGESIKWTPGGTHDDTYMLIGLWMRGTNQTADSSFQTAYVVNNFGTVGAKALEAYWDAHMLPDDILELIKQNGKVDFFQDSLELESSNGGFMSASNTFWTKDFLDQFSKRRGYQLNKYLPLIFIPAKKGMNGSNIGSPVKFDLTGEPKLSEKVRRDYYQTLTELYQEYLNETRKWCNGHGMNLRTQVSYGETLETSMPIRNVDIPETETFFFADQLDGYRSQSGAAHLYNKNILSFELGARGGEAYSMTVPYSLSQIYKAFSGGVNQIIWHGYASKAGPAGIVKWPGYEGIGIIWSERWGDRQPMWRDANDLTSYIGRIQTVLRNGIQKLDVGILRSSYFEENFSGGGLKYWKDLSMQETGYSYEFFAPQLLEDDSITVDKNGIFAPDGPAYKAIVINQSQIPLNSAKALLRYAQNGLPVVIVGNVPNETPYNDGLNDQLVVVMTDLASLNNVVKVDTQAQIVNALKNLGVTPRVNYGDSSNMLNVLRTTKDNSFVYPYNQSNESIKNEIGIDGLGKPYEMNPWTGEIKAIAKYHYKDGKTFVSVSLNSGSIALYGLDKTKKDLVYAISSNADEVGYKDNKLNIVATKTGKYTTVLNNGIIKMEEVSVPDAFNLNKWHLKVEDWRPGDKVTITENANSDINGFYTTTEEYYKTNKNIIESDLTKLKPWTKIAKIGNTVSGIGHYTTSFNLPKGWTGNNGAYLELGPIFETVSVYVNGKKMLPADLNNYKVDISDGLHEGKNAIEVIVTTTLNNRLIETGLLKLGDTFLNSKRAIQEYGLTNQTRIVPYTKRIIFSTNEVSGR